MVHFSFVFQCKFRMRSANASGFDLVSAFDGDRAFRSPMTAYIENLFKGMPDASMYATKTSPIVHLFHTPKHTFAMEAQQSIDLG